MQVIQNSDVPPKKHSELFELLGAGLWSVPLRASDIEPGGTLTRAVFRGPAASTVIEVIVKVWCGTPGEYTAATLPATGVKASDVIYQRAEIAVTGHATDSDDDYNLLKNDGGSVYSGEVWYSVYSTVAAAGDDDAELTLYAV